MNDHFEHVLHELFHLDLLADGLSKEALFDDQRRDRTKRRDQCQQFDEAIGLGRVLLVNVRLKEDVRLFVEIGNRGKVIQSGVDRRWRVRGVDVKENEAFQANHFVGIDLQRFEFGENGLEVLEIGSVDRPDVHFVHVDGKLLFDGSENEEISPALFQQSELIVSGQGEKGRYCFYPMDRIEQDACRCFVMIDDGILETSESDAHAIRLTTFGTGEW